MTFEEYLQSAPEDIRINMMQHLGTFGEPNAVLNELAAIEPCVQSKKLDVRINHQYLLWHQNKSFWVRGYTRLFKMDAIKYCYLCYEGGNLNELGLIGINGSYKELTVQGGQESILIFNKLRSYIKGFESINPADRKDQLAEVEVPAGIHINAHYVLRNDTISLKRTTFFGRKKEEVKVQDLNDLIWCAQRLEVDSEGGDSHIIDLYCLGQKQPCTLYFTSNHTGFQFVLELKKRVPHLLYGYNKEYEELYKQNPAALLAIGKSR